MRMLHLLALCTLVYVTAGHGPELAVARAGGDDWQRRVDLRGPWRFQIGDDARWASPDWNDADWDQVFVPAPWEDEGFPGYDGYAWYRRHVRLEAGLKGEALYLRLGRIDDVDEVYVNGHLIGRTGSFPRNYKTAYHQERVYRIPDHVLRYGRENVIAVRVFDEGLVGGIYDGTVGLYVRTGDPALAVDLAGIWQFHPGDDRRWKEEKIDDDDWEPVLVPAMWEPQGYPDLDGYAWYRVRFLVPERLRREQLVLLLGRIDDLDEAYVNGVPVGRTGNPSRRHIEGDEYRRFRAYPLPEDALRFGATNTLAVRVYDGLIDGGIYEGPVGIATRGAVERWRDGEPGLWKYLRDWFFDER